MDVARPTLRDRGLSARLYFDPEILAAEQDALFLKAWHCGAHVSELAEIGATTLVEIFDQSVILTMTETGPRAFMNVCPHRGHRLVEAPGARKRFTCPYHAWAFHLDGTLFGARGRDVAPEICLIGARVERFLDFYFVNIDPDAASMASLYPGLSEAVRAAVPDLATYRPRTAATDYFGGGYAANWKVLVDNFLECYHCEGAHPDFADLVNVPASTMALSPRHTHQILPWSGKRQNRAYEIDPERDALTGHFWYLFPNTTLSVFPGAKNFSVSHFVPLSAETTDRRFHMTAPSDTDPAAEAARAAWGLDVVNEEDKRLCEGVQRGLRQRGFSRGHYLVHPDRAHQSEEAVRHFHTLYAEAMGVD